MSRPLQMFSCQYKLIEPGRVHGPPLCCWKGKPAEHRAHKPPKTNETSTRDSVLSGGAADSGTRPGQVRGCYRWSQPRGVCKHLICGAPPLTRAPVCFMTLYFNKRSSVNMVLRGSACTRRKCEPGSQSPTSRL